MTDRYYSGSYPAAMYSYGLYDTGRLVGAAIFSSPVQTRVLTILFPDLQPLVASVNLGRFVLDHDVAANGESAPCRGRCNNSAHRPVPAVSLCSVDQSLA